MQSSYVCDESASTHLSADERTVKQRGNQRHQGHQKVTMLFLMVLLVPPMALVVRTRQSSVRDASAAVVSPPSVRRPEMAGSGIGAGRSPGSALMPSERVAPSASRKVRKTCS